MSSSNITLGRITVVLKMETKSFRDWYDVADYIRKENLAGRDVTIKDWNYNWGGHEQEAQD